jgi:hypothetical protein
MKIKRAMFRTIENRFGDDRFGSWQCPTHAAFTYYPIQLRRASRNMLLVDHVGSVNLEEYKKIAKDGYPWKCPHCGVLMQYIDDRINLYCS